MQAKVDGGLPVVTGTLGYFVDINNPGASHQLLYQNSKNAPGLHRPERWPLCRRDSGHKRAQEKLAGRLNIKPRIIVSSAEPLDGKTRHLIEEAFGLTPYNFYASSESLCR